MKINKELSVTLMATNLVATILVIAIHYHSKKPIDLSGIFDVYEWNYIFQEFFINGVARTAVPFFAMISGLFLKKKLHGYDSYISSLKNKFYTLLLPYVVASLLIFIASLILKYIFVPDRFQLPTIYSTFYSIIVHPVSGQFWFLRDLIFLMLFSPILIDINKLVNNIWLFILGISWLLDLQIFPIIGGWYIFNIETVFFFCLGAAISQRQNFLVSIINASYLVKLIVFISWISLIGLRIYVDPYLDVWYTKEYTLESILLYKESIALGIISIMQLCYLISKNSKIIYLSGLTFFAFLFHLMPLSYFKIITNKFVNEHFGFYVNFPIAVILVFLIAHLLSKYFPSIYAYLTGGRTPNKALNLR